jgi:hypothetical protein
MMPKDPAPAQGIHNKSGVNLLSAYLCVPLRSSASLRFISLGGSLTAEVAEARGVYVQTKTLP